MWPMLWKEFRQRQKNIWITLSSIWVPVFLFVILISEKFRPEVRTLETENGTLIGTRCLPNETFIFYYFPKSDLTDGIMEKVQETWKCNYNRMATATQDDLNMQLKKAHTKRLSQKLEKLSNNRSLITVEYAVGVLFLNAKDRKSAVEEGNDMHIEIRLPNLATEKEWIINDIRMTYPREFHLMMATQRHILHAIYANKQTGTVIYPEIHYKPTRTLQVVWSGDYVIYYGFFIMFGFVIPLVVVLRRLVKEKSKKLKTLMMLSGVKPLGYFCSIFFVAFCFLLLISALFVAAAATRFNVFTLIILLFVYSLTSVLFTMAFTSFFEQTVYAVPSFLFVWFVLVDVITRIVAKPGPQSIDTIFKGTKTQPDWMHLLICLVGTPNYGLHLFLMLVAERKEMEMKNVTPLDLMTVTSKYDLLSAGSVLISMVASCVLWIFCIWYVRQVWPRKHADVLPFHFPISQFLKNKHEAVQPLEDTRYFEEVPKTLKTCINIENVTKVYDGHHEAVKRANLYLYFGEITALLGNSGSGKTTLMKILANFLKPTHGAVFIDGYDVSKSPEYIKHNVGFCPQETILFDELSVEEHLYLFAYIKGFNTSETDTEVDRILALFGLIEERKHRADSLNKQSERLLQLGIAFVGKPRILILDEPSVGLDVEKRRKVWDLLRVKQTDSMVLFSTTLMEEADSLADRIAIISQGEIKAYGTANFLRKVFRVGYYLIVEKGTQFKGRTFSELLKRHFFTGAINEETRNHTVATFDKSEATRLPHFLSELEDLKNDLGIKSYGLDVMSMEDVFTRADHMLERSSGSLGNLTELVRPMERKLNLLKPGDINPSPKRRLIALLLKRFHVTRRSLTILILNFLWILYMTLQLRGISKPIATVSTLNKWTVEIHGSEFKSRLKVMCKKDTEFCNAIYDKQVHLRVDVEQLVNVSFVEYLEKEAITKLRDPFLGITSVDDTLRGNYTVIYNNDAVLSKLVAVNLIYNALLKKQKLVTTAVSSMDEVVGKPEVDRLLVLFVFITFLFIFPWPLLYIVQERVTQVKLLQLMAGVSSVQYWISNLIFDIIVLLIVQSPFIIACLFFDLFNPDVALIICDFPSLSVFLYALTIFIMSSICVGYLGSFFFSSPSLGYFAILYLLLINYVMQIVKFFLAYWEAFLARATEKLVDFLLYICQLLPLHDFTNVIGFLSKYTIDVRYCKQVIAVSGFDCKNSTNSNDTQALFMKCCQNSGSSDIDGFQTLLRNPTNYITLLAPAAALYVAFLLFLFVEGIQYFRRRKAMKKRETQALAAASPQVSNSKSQGPTPVSKSSSKTTVGKSESKTAVGKSGSKTEVGKSGPKTAVGKKGSQMALSNVHSSHLHSTFEDFDALDERVKCDNLIASEEYKTKALVVHELTKHYHRIAVVNHVSMFINKKEHLGIVGLTHSGKSVLLKMIVGSLESNSGEAYIGDKSLHTNRKLYRQLIGYCPQQNALIHQITGRQMLTLFARIRGIKENKALDAIEDIIKFVDMENIGSDLIENYNSFNKRKLSLALTLVGLPEILILDDPTGWLDLGSKIKLWQIIKQYQAISSSSVVVASRSLQECEQLCTKIAILLKGRVKSIGSAAYLRSKYNQGFTIWLRLNLHLSNSKEVEEAIKLQIPSAVLQGRNGAIRLYQISNTSMPLAQIFRLMESIKIQFQLEEYHVVNSNLQKFFLSFAKTES